MINKFINWFLYTFFQSSMLASFNQGVESGKGRGCNEAVDQRNNDKKESDLFELKKFMDQKIIVFGNGWEDPVFGYGTGIELITKAQQPVLCFKNAVTGEVSVTFGKVFLYNDMLMNAVLMLNPYQRWELATGQNLLMTESDKLSDLTPPEEMVSTLKNIGYLDKDFVFDQGVKCLEIFNDGVREGEKNMEIKLKPEPRTTRVK